MNTKQLKSLIKEIVKEIGGNPPITITRHTFIFDVPDNQWISIIQPSIAKNTTFKGAIDIRVTQNPKSVIVNNPTTKQTIESVLDGLGLERIAQNQKASLWKFLQ